jgi:hypothetical protein
MAQQIKGYLAAGAAAIVIAGCATSSSEIRPSYVSPLQYQSFSCQQIGAEAARISSRAAEVAGVQDSKREDDKIATGVGVIVFWPALFFIKGDGQTAAELARLRGEYEALEKIAIEKNCKVQFRPANPPA